MQNIESIYKKHSKIVLRRAFYILGSHDDAKDVLQDVFISLVEKPESFRRESKLTSFLYSATTHRCLTRLRNKKTRLRILEEEVKPSLSEEINDQSEAQLIIRQALVKVPKKLVEPAIYYYLDGMKQQEIAEVMGCSQKQVSKLLVKFKKECEKIHGVNLKDEKHV